MSGEGGTAAGTWHTVTHLLSFTGRMSTFTCSFPLATVDGAEVS